MKYTDGEGGRLLALRLQALGQKAALRRHAQDPGMIAQKIRSSGAVRSGAVAWRLRLVRRQQPSSDASVVYCPQPLTVADAQRLTRFKDGPGRDPRDVVFEAALVASGTTCELSAQPARRRRDHAHLGQCRPVGRRGHDAGAVTSCACIDASGAVVQGQEFTADFRLIGGQSARHLAGGDCRCRLPFNQISDLGGYRIAVGLKPSPGRARLQPPGNRPAVSRTPPG